MEVSREEEEYWRIRSRVTWLAKGDSNTSFFHKIATANRRRNFIYQLKDADGLYVYDEELKQSMIHRYYKSIFGQDHIPHLSMYWDTLYPQASTLAGMDDMFTEEECRLAVFGLNADKAAGPDGFGAGFYQKFWPLIKNDVMSIFAAFYSEDSSLVRSFSRINLSVVALIPKGNAPDKVEDFRPISLLNCSMKIITKIMATRLSLYISSMVDSSQSAFQRGMSSLDSIGMAHELVHYSSRKRSDICILKIDFRKAFDSISWDFLLSVLKGRKFSDRWCAWIETIIFSSSTAVIVNGVKTRQISCKRGLHQGDPLSPLLFILVTDVLSQMINQAFDRGFLQDLNLKGNLNSLRSLQFADDTLIISKATSKDISTIKIILYLFEKVSGLSVNYAKSNLFYMGKIAGKGERMASLLNCQIGKLPFVYLGLPFAYGKLSKKDWDPLVAKLQKRLSSWNARSLSFGGRLTLINSVLTDLPLYFISFFKLPKWLVKKINSIRARFLWGTTECFRSSKHLVRWDNVAALKEEGGMGVLDIQTFNSSLMAKWLWKGISPNNPLGSLLRSVYAPNTSILNL